ncbi:MAG: PAS domain-containing protein [Gemmatimonadetes bacterium]|nr:PAS domain-containing protein [Gemmatimonadota bacterium]
MATSPADSTPVPNDDPAALPDSARRLAQREAAFAAVVESAGDVIVQIDAELRVTYINPAAARAAGVPASEIVGRAALTVPLDEAFKGIWLTAIRDTILTGLPVMVDYDFPAPDGTTSRFQARFTPEPDTEHGGTGVFVIARDITALHRAAEALANREAELRAIVDGVEDLMMRFDAQGRIAFVNPAFARAVGHPVEDFINRAPADVLVDPVARAAFSTALHRVLRDGRAETLEFEYQRASEPSARYYVTRFTPLRNSHGQVNGVLTLSHDLTERRATELERERLLQELLHAKAAVTTLKGLLPTCSWCHKIRDEHGHWEQMESYIAKRSEAEFSHGLCPECAVKMLTE